MTYFGQVLEKSPSQVNPKIGKKPKNSRYQKIHKNKTLLFFDSKQIIFYNISSYLLPYGQKSQFITLAATRPPSFVP